MAAAALGVAAACAKGDGPPPAHPALPAANDGACLPDTGGSAPSPTRRAGWTGVAVTLVAPGGDLRMLFLADSAGATRLAEMGPLGPTGKAARTWSLMANWGTAGSPTGVQAATAASIREALDASLKLARSAGDTVEVLRSRVRNVPAGQAEITPLTPESGRYAAALAGWVRTRCAGLLGAPR